MKTLVIQNSQYTRPGRILPYLETHHRQEYRLVMLRELREIGHDRFDYMIVLGGEQSARSSNEDIKHLIGFVQAALGEDTKVLGICLGAQILSEALKFKFVEKGVHEPEIGFHELKITDFGRKTGIFRDGQKVLTSHNEGFVAPLEKLLATTVDWHQAFLHGNAIGVQYHPEARLEDISEWIGEEGLLHPEIAAVTAEINNPVYDEDFNRLMAYFFRS